MDRWHSIFTGERWGAYTELLFLRARWYVPGVGRFASRDPWDGNYEDPRSLNGFSYASNNPTRLVDPSGATPEQCEDWGWKTPWKELFCEPAERGNVDRMEAFYRLMALGSRVVLGWDTAPDLLEHFLDGGGEFVQVNSSWYLRNSHAQEQRDNLIQLFVDDYVEPAHSACEDRVTAKLEPKYYVCPAFESFPEHAVGMGCNYITGFFGARLYGSHWSIRATFLVPDRFDFDFVRKLTREFIDKAAGFTTGIGDVPHTWTKRLEEQGNVKPFCMGVVWGENLGVSAGQWKDWTGRTIWHNGHPVWGTPPTLQATESSPDSYSICYGDLCATRRY